MARIRTIKPEFTKDEDLSSLPAEAHLFAAGLLCEADDYGYFNANPKLLQAAVFPLRENSVSVPDILQRLSEIGFIETFDGSDGRRYGRVVKFLQHQRVSHPTPSKIAPLVSRPEKIGSPPEPLRPEGKGKEEEGKGKGSDKPAPSDASELNASACAGRLMDALLISGLQNRTICDEAISRCAKRRNCSAMDATEHILAQAKLYQQSEQYASQWRKPWVKWLAGGHWSETPEQWKERRNDPNAIPAAPKERTLLERVRRQRAGMDPDGSEPTPPELMVN